MKIKDLVAKIKAKRANKEVPQELSSNGLSETLNQELPQDEPLTFQGEIAGSDN